MGRSTNFTGLSSPSASSVRPYRVNDAVLPSPTLSVFVTNVVVVEIGMLPHPFVGFEIDAKCCCLLNVVACCGSLRVCTTNTHLKQALSSFADMPFPFVFRLLLMQHGVYLLGVCSDAEVIACVACVACVKFLQS